MTAFDNDAQPNLGPASTSLVTDHNASTKRSKSSRIRKGLFGSVVALAAVAATLSVNLDKDAANAATTTINVSDKAAVNAAYWSLVNPSLTTPSGSTAVVSSCTPGTSSANAKTQTLNAINFARRLNGLSPVGLAGATDNANAQRTALMMEANGKLSHSPDKSWRCWTSAGAATAAKSNIGLFGYSDTPVGMMIRAYLNDPGAGNEAVGHRRWFLYPEAKTFSVGATKKASAIQVVGLPTSTANPNPAYVAWPRGGYFPDALEPNGRWSLSAGLKTASFAKATIKVTRAGVSVPVTKYAPHNGYGRPTLVWAMPSTFPKTGVYTVTVSNITRTDSKAVTSLTYNVNFFTPYK